MNSFAVVIVFATMSLFGLFVQPVDANVKKCFVCTETNINACGNSKESELNSIECPTPDATTKCYEIVVKKTSGTDAVGVLRGCTKDATCGDQLVSHKVLDEGQCQPCASDECNKSKLLTSSTTTPSAVNLADAPVTTTIATTKNPITTTKNPITTTKNPITTGTVPVTTGGGSVTTGSGSVTTDSGPVTGNGTGNSTTPGNGQPSFAGSAVLCALLSSLAVSKMYFHTM